jgi:TRAP-type C4-dicarboxylate transport system permease small subunit
MSELRATFGPLAIAGLLAGALAWAGWRLWERELGHHNLALKIGAVFGPAAAAGVLYWVIGIAAKVPAAREILSFVFGRFSGRKTTAG